MGDLFLCTSSLAVQHQRCMKFRVLRTQDFCTPLALNGKKAGRPSIGGVKDQPPSKSALSFGVIFLGFLVLFTSTPRNGRSSKESLKAKIVNNLARPFYLKK